MTGMARGAFLGSFSSLPISFCKLGPSEFSRGADKVSLTVFPWAWFPVSWAPDGLGRTRRCERACAQRGSRMSRTSQMLSIRACA
jgi:hypothetical protein